LKKKKKNIGFLNFDFLKSQQESSNESGNDVGYNDSNLLNNQNNSSTMKMIGGGGGTAGGVDLQVDLLDIILEDQWNPYFILFSTKHNILNFLLFFELIVYLNQKEKEIFEKEENEIYISFILKTFFNPISIYDLDLPLKIKHQIELSKEEKNFKFFDEIITQNIKKHIIKLYKLFLNSDYYLEMILKFSIEHQKMSLSKELETGSPRQINFEEKIVSPRQSKKEIKKKKKLEKELEEKEEFIEFKNDLFGMEDFQRFILDKMGKVLYLEKIIRNDLEFELDQMSKEIDDIEFD